MDHRYNHHNRRKYSLKAHIVLVTKYRKQLLKGSIADDVKQKIFDIANTRGYEIIAMETDKDHVHFLIDYKSGLMARDSQGSSHHLKVVGGAYGKRKDLIYEMISYTQSTLGAVRNKSFSTADFRESVFRFNISSALIHFIGIFSL